MQGCSAISIEAGPSTTAALYSHVPGQTSAFDSSFDSAPPKSESLPQPLPQPLPSVDLLFLSVYRGAMHAGAVGPRTWALDALRTRFTWYRSGWRPAFFIYLCTYYIFWNCSFSLSERTLDAAPDWTFYCFRAVTVAFDVPQ